MMPRGWWRAARRVAATVFAVIVLVAAVVVPAHADHPPLPAILEDATFDQHLNAQVPLDLAFRDESGAAVRLGDYFVGKPVILTMNYYECPNLCPLVIDGLTASLKELSFTMGDEFRVVTVGIDPREGPAQAAERKANYVRRYARPGAEDSWHFLTGEPAAIERLAATVGFNYTYDEEQQQYAHPSGIMVLTPEGKIARYIYGLQFAPRDLRLALVEASQNKIGTVVDQVLLFCYRYDPATGKYGAVAANTMRIGGMASALAIGLFLVMMWRRDVGRGPDKLEPVG